MRKSIRPVTLRRVIEVLSLAVGNGSINEKTLVSSLKTTKRRARAILLELQRMSNLKSLNGVFVPSLNANKILDAYGNGDWRRIHNILYENYDFYHVFIDAVSSEKSLTKSDILQRLSNQKELAFNKTSIDTLCDWAERLGQVQRNLYSNRYYIPKGSVNPAFFITTLEGCYQGLNVELRPGLRLTYVEIARLREEVCERLRMDREKFDQLFEEIFRNSIGKIELCGAPITTSAKQSPTSLRTMERGERQDILSPVFHSIREGRGIEIDGRLYHYVAIFESLKGEG